MNGVLADMEKESVISTSRPLKSILIDALSYDIREGGFSTVYRDLVASASLIPNIKLIVICHKKNKAVFEQEKCKVIPIWFPYKLRYFISQLITPYIVWKLKVDHVHFETTAIPFFIKKEVSITVHDLFFLKENYVGGSSLGNKLLDIYWRYFYTRRTHRANKIRVISKATQTDVGKFLGRHKGVSLVYPVINKPVKSVAPTSFPVGDSPLKLLFVGSIIPRKNLTFLLEAIDVVNRPVVLQVAGNCWDSTILSQWSGNARVIFHGFVSEDELESLYSDSHFLVSPSVEEGFGLPVVEAMTRSTGVLTSDIPVYQEFVVDDARFDLDTPTKLAILIDSITEDFYRKNLETHEKIAESFSEESFREGFRQLFGT